MGGRERGREGGREGGMVGFHSIHLGAGDQNGT